MSQELEKIIGYRFKNNTLIKEALTHSSKGGKQFQRLEFLGDRILNLSMTLILLESLPQATEGELAKRLSILVSSRTLNSIAKRWNLGQFIDCLPSQIEAVLSDCVEAVLGSIFLDSKHDLELCRRVIANFWEGALEEGQDYDPKTRLQELTHKLYRSAPVYETTAQNDSPHDPTFSATVTVDKNKCSGIGKSIKEAQKNAAQKMLEILG